jgi:hypothetical protein
VKDVCNGKNTKRDLILNIDLGNKIKIYIKEIKKKTKQEADDSLMVK